MAAVVCTQCDGYGYRNEGETNDDGAPIVTVCFWCNGLGRV